MSDPKPTHTPVLVSEILDIFQPDNSHTYLDATLGHAGHALAFLKAASEAKIVGLDADPQAIKQAEAKLSKKTKNFNLFTGNFGNLEQILPADLSFDRILLDLGIGSHQLDDKNRGFSFRSQARLSLLFGPAQTLPQSTLEPLNKLENWLGYLPDAQDLIINLSHADLELVIRTYGEERFAGRIAGALKNRPPQTANQLSEAVLDAVPDSYHKQAIHPATRSFQALRIAVNRELDVLAVALPQLVERLNPDGILAVISFHSLEDRIVKNYFRSDKNLAILTKKPIGAADQEKKTNPRSRSSKLRAALKTKNSNKHVTTQPTSYS